MDKSTLEKSCLFFCLIPPILCITLDRSLTADALRLPKTWLRLYIIFPHWCVSPVLFCRLPIALRLVVSASEGLLLLLYVLHFDRKCRSDLLQFFLTMTITKSFTKAENVNSSDKCRFYSPPNMMFKRNALNRDPWGTPKERNILDKILLFALFIATFQIFHRLLSCRRVKKN